MYPLVEDMSKIYARPLPRVYAIFLFAIEYSAKAQHTTTRARGGGGAPHRGRAALLLCVEPWLITQWQTEKWHILLAEDGHIFDIFSTIFLSNLICESIQDHNITKYPIFGYI